MNSYTTLLTRALEEDLSATERAELLQAMENDPALREEWSRQALLHGLLGPAMEGAFTREQRIAKCMSAVCEADQELFVRKVRKQINWVRYRRVLAWAAVLVVGLLLWAVTLPRPVATIIQIDSLGETTSLTEGTQFFKRDWLRIDSGLVELDLAGRGRMVLEGPAKLRWSTSLKSTLHEGRVLLRINKRGQGYHLATPQGSIIDLGTEFGAFIDSLSGQVETHVLDGEVRALPASGDRPIQLRKNEALRLSSTHSERIPADWGAFYRTTPPRHSKPIRMVHWSMKADDHGRVRSYTRGFDEERSGLEMRGGPQPVEGPFGSAMYFDGTGAYAEAQYRGVGGTHPRTVAFWVKVPRDFEPNQGFGIISWGQFNRNAHGSVWQISINPWEKDGAIGRLRLGVHGGQVIGSTDLRDGRWHHVAVVLYPAENPEISQHVLLYLNGRVESISSRVLGGIDTHTEESAHGVWLARNITDSAIHGRFFRGAIAEVYIFDAALTQDEIHTLMERNKAPQATAPTQILSAAWQPR